MKKCVSVLVLVLCLLVGAAPSLRAQGTGAVGGTVVDASGAALPGVTVTLSSREGTVGSNQEQITDARGTYQFPRLVPGRYIVRAQLEGFRTAEQQNISVNSDATSRADLVLEIGALEEAITVTTAAPLLDTASALKQTAISREQLELLPNRTDVWSMARVIPGVVIGKIDVGGSEMFEGSAITVRGSSGENKFFIDGMDMSSVTGNASTALLYLDPYLFEESNYQVGAASSEQANGGLTMNMVTRTGTNQLHFGFKGNYVPPSWSRSRNYSDALREQLLANVPSKVRAANPDLQPNADIRLMRDVGGWLTGPIVRDKLWLSSVYHDQRMNRYRLGSYDPDGSPVIDDNIMWNTANKLAWQITRTTQLSYLNLVQRKVIGHRGGGTFADSRARNYNPKLATLNQMKATSVLRSSLALELALSRMGAYDNFGKQPEVSLGDVATFDTTTQVSGVALPTYDIRKTARPNLIGSLSWASGKHAFKAGYEFSSSKRAISQWTISGLRAVFANGVPTSVNTYPVFLTSSNEDIPTDLPELYRWREQTHSAFVQDRWTPHSKLTLNLGLRFDTSDSWQQPTCRPDTQFVAGQCFDRIDAPSFRNLAPRFNMVYDLQGDGRTALKLAANRYNQSVSVSMIARLSPTGTIVSDQRQWLDVTRCGQPNVLGCDRNGDLIPQLNELGPSPGYVFPGIRSSYAPDVKHPNATEYTAELQRQLPKDLVASAVYVVRNTDNEIGERNTAVLPGAWIGPLTVTEVVSGQTVQVWNRPSTASAVEFFNADSANVSYHGLDLTLNKRLSNRWSLMAGATFGKATTGGQIGNRNDPNLTSYFDSDVLVEGDRPWSYRLSGVYQLPRDIFFSGTLQAQAGAPERTTVLVTNQTLTLSQGNQAILIAPVGAERYPNLVQLDFNIRKQFSVGKWRVSPRLEVFNATNQSTIDLWVTQLGPTYQRPANLQRARLVKLEVGVEF